MRRWQTSSGADQAIEQRRDRGWWGPALVLPRGLQAAPSASLPLSTALKSSPSKKGRGALLAVKPLGPTAAFSASQIPSEREDAQYDLRGARSYPTLEDEGDQAGWGVGALVTGERRGLLGKGFVPGGLRAEGIQGATQCKEGFPEAGNLGGRGLGHSHPPSQPKVCSRPGRGSSWDCHRES